jgi:hypothetical protein
MARGFWRAHILTKSSTPTLNNPVDSRPFGDHKGSVIGNEKENFASRGMRMNFHSFAYGNCIYQSTLRMEENFTEHFLMAMFSQYIFRAFFLLPWLFIPLT